MSRITTEERPVKSPFLFALEEDDDNYGPASKGSDDDKGSVDEDEEESDEEEDTEPDLGDIDDPGFSDM